MVLFVWILCKPFAFTLWSSTFATTSRTITQSGLFQLSNFWRLRKCFSRLMWVKNASPCEQIRAKEPMTEKRIYSAGATSDCQYYEICVRVENENTPICRRGILTKHENCFGEHGLVLYDELDILILARHGFSINNILVNCG